MCRIFHLFPSSSTALSPGHPQPHRPRVHPGAPDLRARPGRPGSVQRARPGNVRPEETQVLRRGAEAAADDQEGTQGLHPRGHEGELLLCVGSEPLVWTVVV